MKTRKPTDTINFVQTGALNEFKDYKDEYIQTLEALVQSQRELIETLRKSQVIITQPAPNNIPYTPYTGPYISPTIPNTSPFTFPNGTITCETSKQNGGSWDGVMSFNSGRAENLQSSAKNMGPEYAG